MEFKVRFTGSTIKALEQVLRQGFREADVRLMRRVHALLEIGAGRSVPLVAERLELNPDQPHGVNLSLGGEEILVTITRP